MSTDSISNPRASMLLRKTLAEKGKGGETL
jgi:hypothetical protein